ncbi:MAG: hypothetical protein MRY32_08420 [Rickettsiales bacterium]|nr:hypothetical protein [Rickettsiales bacterium]
MLKHFAILTSFALFLSACSTGTAYDLGANVEEGETLGNYQITTLEVVPTNPSMAQDKDFQIIKPFIERELVQAFTNVGTNRPAAGLTVEITHISAELNAFTAAMVGDGYNINGRAHVWQGNRNNKIADVKVISHTGPLGGGIIGVFNAANTSEQEEMAYRNEVASLFAREIRGAIYPEYDN